MYGLYRIAFCSGKLRDLKAGIGRIATAVVEEITDVVRLEDFDESFIFGCTLSKALEFVAAGTECASGGVAQCCNSGL